MADELKVLWLIGVFERPTDARLQMALIRHDLQKRVDILLFCNAEKEELATPMHSGEDLYIRWKNSGHYNGCRDAFNSGMSCAHLYDYVVWTQAKNVMSHPTMVMDVIGKLEQTGKPLAVLDDSKRLGKFKDEKEYSIHGDLLVMKSVFYQKICPWTDDLSQTTSVWPEKSLYRRIIQQIWSQDCMLFIDCVTPKVPQQSKECQFEDLMERKGSWLSASYDVAWKIERLKLDRPDFTFKE